LRRGGRGLGRLFGTDGVRGIINRDFTPEFVLKLSLAIGSFFGEGSRILVGRDARAGGYIFKSILIGGLLASGIKVYDCDLAPTPAIQYVVSKHGFDGGVVVTASHNPPHYNGIKVIAADGIEIDRNSEEVIEDIFFTERFRRVDWASLVNEPVPYRVVNEIYVKAIIDLVDRDLIAKKGFRVLVDPGNSVAALTTPIIARELGVKVMTINSDLNPHFTSREPEPTMENLSTTIATVRGLNVDLAVAHDGDGDRAIFIDDLGRYIPGERSAALLIEHLVDKHPGLSRKVYTAVSSSNFIEEYLKKYGVEFVWLKVGSVGIAREMKSRGDALCGFEENGGFMYPIHQFVRDGGASFALMLEYLASNNIKLSEAYAKLPKTCVVKTKIHMDRARADRVVETIKNLYSGYRMVTVDGVKVITSNYWFLVRPSGTEPLLRIHVEAIDDDTANRVLQELKKIIDGVL